ncbi:hypothetical protein FSP39_000533 [Pinctada imbricata]|uniref:CARD domain-containing protein n=1 Tax=Pinctada imbricata TaxID=66713 RepID=A0AA88YUH3_PINIB|nr:hypothetical protein FSP39_000533 [Pinctada imbricata]
MEQNHQEVIRKNYDTLLKKMNLNKVVKNLHDMRILTSEMKEKIDNEKSIFAKGKIMIDNIIHRGPHAFMAFRMALMKAGDYHLAKILLEESKSTKGEGTEKQLDRDLVIDLDNDSDQTAEQSKESLNQQRCMINLGDNIYLVVKTYNGDLTIHIRQFEETLDGKLFPTKKGVIFPLHRWVLFLSYEENITKCLKSHSDLEEEQSWHLGGGVFAKIHPDYPNVNIRHFWKPENSAGPVPTKKGVILNRFRYNNLLEGMKKIQEVVPELMNIEPCPYSDDHQNQQGMLDCKECTPFPMHSYSEEY